MKKNLFESRKYVIGSVVVVVVLTYILRLFSLQIASDEYKLHADSNAFLKNTQYPARGIIYDRNDSLLVYNQPAYDVTFIPREVENLDTLDLCNSLGITREYFEKRMNDVRNRNLNPGYSRYTHQTFLTQLSGEEFSIFQEKLFRFPGFYVQRRSIRQYTCDVGAHVLGDIAEVSKKEIEDDDYYYRGDYIGKQGIERSYETQLRGEKGVEILLRDVHGRIQGRYMDGAMDIPSIPGKNLHLGLDIELQALGERLLEGKIGSIVAIEPKTGEILCMVSAPSFDPHLMTGRQRGANQLELSRDGWKPLLNRAIMGTYPPGSTFKTSQALTFLEEGIVTEHTAYPCHGGFVHRGLRVGCHAHSSPISVVPSLATSCNAYYCWGLYYMIGSRSKYGSVQNAMNRWRDYMVSMGFGYALGVDLPGEKRGLEGEPLDSLYTTRRYTMASEKNYDIVVKGMREAVLNGTCRGANLPGIEVCGKTGTAQNRGKDHSIFMGFAPMDDPQIAVAVYVENGGFGATFGVPIGALIMEQYLTGGLSPESQAKAEDIRRQAIHYDEKR